MTHFAVGKAPHGKGPRTKRQRRTEEEKAHPPVKPPRARTGRGEADDRGEE